MTAKLIGPTIKALEPEHPAYYHGETDTKIEVIVDNLLTNDKVWDGVNHWDFEEVLYKAGKDKVNDLMMDICAAQNSEDRNKAALKLNMVLSNAASAIAGLIVNDVLKAHKDYSED